MTGLFYSPLSDPQDADADSNASDIDCDIDNANERKTRLNGWQYFMHKKLVSNFYGVSLSLKSPPFLFFLEIKAIEQLTKVLMKKLTLTRLFYFLREKILLLCEFMSK